jgi:hypothetical protein
VDPNLTSPTQSAGTFSDGTTAILPGSGWGANNSGPRLPNGQYNAQFTFSGLTATDIEAGNGSSCPEPTTEAASKLCWELAADYDGETDYVWSSETTENAPSSTSTAVISVYGPRDNR